ncbi:MAG: phosphoenolpyruvate carboxykinase (ATP), partial [Kordiimonadaceae bacterium]|nr:phosphoenolpyruvate carboxykinase (ATP) [Kordiimonadaceae bacterium]
MEVFGACSNRVSLDAQGITDTGNQYWNLGTAQLYEEAIRRGEGKIAEGGALVVATGDRTGRSANDKFTVRDEGTENTVDWGKVNRPMTPENFDRIHQAFLAHMKGNDVFKVAVRTLEAMVDKVLLENGLEQGQIDWFVPHQANIRIIEATAK